VIFPLQALVPQVILHGPLPQVMSPPQAKTALQLMSQELAAEQSIALGHWKLPQTTLQASPGGQTQGPLLQST
jgi:hypothetical protein